MNFNIQQGLCSTCNNNPGCTFLEERGFQALQCEMYDGYAPTKAQERIKSYLVPEPPYSSQTKDDHLDEQYDGLCKNCENRKGCSFAKAKGGIWQCEEYA